MRLLLIRHAQSSANAEGRMQGRLDISLSEHGRAQSVCLADRLDSMGPVALYASPLLRARETAEIVSARVGLPVIDRPGLMERDVGVLAGLTRDEIMTRFPEFAVARREGRRVTIEGFEEHEPFSQRVRDTFDEILEAHDDGCVAVVTHGGVVGAFLRWALEIPPERSGLWSIDNVSVTTIEVGDGTRPTARPRFQLVGLNDTCHLDGIGER